MIVPAFLQLADFTRGGLLAVPAGNSVPEQYSLTGEG